LERGLLPLVNEATPDESNSQERSALGRNRGRPIAAALGALVTPIAAVIAFVDPGLAKDQNCAAMIAEADSKGPRAPKSDIPTPNRPASKSEAAAQSPSGSTLR
jgi:hypothetical protein